MEATPIRAIDRLRESGQRSRDLPNAAAARSDKIGKSGRGRAVPSLEGTVLTEQDAVGPGVSSVSTGGSGPGIGEGAGVAGGDGMTRSFGLSTAGREQREIAWCDNGSSPSETIVA